MEKPNFTAIKHSKDKKLREKTYSIPQWITSYFRYNILSKHSLSHTPEIVKSFSSYIPSPRQLTGTNHQQQSSTATVDYNKDQTF